jgi:hypothetical protein
MHRKAENETNEKSTKNEVDEAQGRTSGGQSQASQTESELDFESLDLSIETVEERISPSETNVFDK